MLSILDCKKHEISHSISKKQWIIILKQYLLINNKGLKSGNINSRKRAGKIISNLKWKIVSLHNNAFSHSINLFYNLLLSHSHFSKFQMIYQTKLNYFLPVKLLQYDILIPSFSQYTVQDGFLIFSFRAHYELTDSNFGTFENLNLLFSWEKSSYRKKSSVNVI